MTIAGQRAVRAGRDGSPFELWTTEGLFDAKKGSVNRSVDPTDDLRAFRERGLCMNRRSDALFELVDAILTVRTSPSMVHLSLGGVHRRGWVSLYAALRRGRIDADALRDLLVNQPSTAQRHETPCGSGSGTCGPARPPAVLERQEQLRFQSRQAASLRASISSVLRRSSA